MFERLNKDIIAAMKSGEKFRMNVLKLLKSEIQANEKGIAPKPALDVVAGHRKKLAKNLDLYKDLPEKLDELKKELAILDDYLPKALSKEEIIAVIDKHVALGNFGQVMKAVRADLSGPFDGKMVSTLIKEKLES